MVKKRKDADEAPPRAHVPDKLARPFAEALKGIAVKPVAMKQGAALAPKKPSFVDRFEARVAAPIDKLAAEKPAPDAPRLSHTDITALRDAFAGVKPMDERGRMRVARPPAGADAPIPRGEKPDMHDADKDARARLGALVAGGVRFEIWRSEDGRVHGLRVGADARVLQRVRKGEMVTEAENDFHGMSGDEAESECVRFVRQQHKRGRRVLRLVHGKGNHSQGGVGVLRDRVIHALTEGGAAPLVVAFATARAEDGGAGALVVVLQASY